MAHHPTASGHEKGRDSLKKRRMSQAFTVPPPTKAPALRYANTYRLDPKRPLNKEVCENIVKKVVNNSFENFRYSPKVALVMAAQVCDDIKNRVKTYNYDRYRYVVNVTIGEKLMQGCCSLVNFLWDAERDGFITYVFDTPKFFAVATLYYLYYD